MKYEMNKFVMMSYSCIREVLLYVERFIIYSAVLTDPDPHQSDADPQHCRWFPLRLCYVKFVKFMCQNIQKET